LGDMPTALSVWNEYNILSMNMNNIYELHIWFQYVNTLYEFIIWNMSMN
jgi:hypothetical protein